MNILIIHNEAFMLNMVESILRRLGYYITTCTSPDDVAFRNKEIKYDAIIIGVSFYEYEREKVIDSTWRETKYLKKVPVIILAEISQRELILEALDSGADDFVINLNELSLRMMRLFRGKR